MKGGWSCDGVWGGLNFGRGRLIDGVVEVESILFGLELVEGNLDTSTAATLDKRLTQGSIQDAPWPGTCLRTHTRANRRNCIVPIFW